METGRRQDGQRGQGDRETDTTEAGSLRRTQALCPVWEWLAGFLFPGIGDLFAMRGRRAEEPEDERAVGGSRSPLLSGKWRSTPVEAEMINVLGM